MTMNAKNSRNGQGQGQFLGVNLERDLCIT